MSDKDRKRKELIVKILNETRCAFCKEYDRKFYEAMMEMKNNGDNLWNSEGEEAFYRRLTR